jgi:predicted patatin/cPLA2 family phospholipase
MRGIFTAGVLDGLAGSSEPPYDLVIGVSSGAYCASSYLAGQHGRIRRIVTRHMTGTNYANPWRMLAGGSLIDQAYLMGPVTRELEPLDLDALRGSPVRFEVVATDALTGFPAYLPAQERDCLDAIHASVAVPFFYRQGPVAFRGSDYFDGSVSDPVPVARALSLGATHVTVVLTRRGPPPPLAGLSRAFLSVALRRWPAIPGAMARRHEVRSMSLEALASAPAPVDVRVILPPADFPVRRFTRDADLVLRGYEMGLGAVA